MPTSVPRSVVMLTNASQQPFAILGKDTANAKAPQPTAQKPHSNSHNLPNKNENLRKDVWGIDRHPGGLTELEGRLRNWPEGRPKEAYDKSAKGAHQKLLCN